MLVTFHGDLKSGNSKISSEDVEKSRESHFHKEMMEDLKDLDL